MSAIQGISSAPLSQLQQADLAVRVSPSKSEASADPGDSFVPGTVGSGPGITGKPAAISPSMEALVLRGAVPLQVDEFFSGPTAGTVTGMESLPAADDGPAGKWKVSVRTPFDPSGVRDMRTTTVELPRDTAFGTRVGSASAEETPFGRWIRMAGGWVGQCVRPCADEQSPVQASMLNTWLPDDGPMEMTLWESHRNGSGVIFRLDGEAARRDFSTSPAVTGVFSYEPGDPALPPFFMPILPAASISPMAASLGKIPDARFSRVQHDNFISDGGWKVDLPDPKPTVRSLQMSLVDQEEPGAVRGGSRAEDGVVFGKWTRVAGAWESETEGRLLPEQFGVVEGSCLRTRLADDGTVSMDLRVTNLDGTGTEYSLDPAGYTSWHAGAMPAPRVMVEQKFGQARFETRTGTPQGNTGLPPELTGASEQAKDQTIRDEGGWIVIGGVRIQKS